MVGASVELLRPLAGEVAFVETGRDVDGMSLRDGVVLRVRQDDPDDDVDDGHDDEDNHGHRLAVLADESDLKARQIVSLLRRAQA